MSQACGDDGLLRRRLEELLAADQVAGPAPAQPAIAPVSEGPGTVIGQYKLLEKLGEGGCGVVYMAEQEKPVRRRVALKIIKLGMDTRSVIARFEAERQALALMDHPNIAKVLDAGATETGRPYFVMELVGRIGLAPMKPEGNGFTDRPVLLLTHRPRNWWSNGESRPDLRVANALLYCLSYGPGKVARSVGAAPTRLSFGDSAAQAGALRIEIGSPGWVFTGNEKLDPKSSPSDNSATGQSNAECRVQSAK